MSSGLYASARTHLARLLGWGVMIEPFAYMYTWAAGLYGACVQEAAQALPVAVLARWALRAAACVGGRRACTYKQGRSSGAPLLPKHRRR